LHGDSAGGNLSMGAALRLRDAGQGHAVKAILSNYSGFSSDVSPTALQEPDDLFLWEFALPHLRHSPGWRTPATSRWYGWKRAGQFDKLSGILAAACRNGVLKFIDARDDHDRGQLEIGQGADSSIFNADKRIGCVPCLDGSLTVYRLDAAGRVTATQHLATRVGARTAAYDSQRDLLYIASAEVERDAAGTYLRAVRGFRLLTVGSTGTAR